MKTESIVFADELAPGCVANRFDQFGNAGGYQPAICGVKNALNGERFLGEKLGGRLPPRTARLAVPPRSN
jgi:hypothetical protein